MVNWEDHIKLAYFVAHKYKGVIEFDDATQAALYGLYKASLHFDESKNIKFVTYATMVMHNEIRMTLRAYKKQNMLQTVSMDTEIKGADVEDIRLEDMLVGEPDIALTLDIKNALKACEERYPGQFICFRLCTIMGIPQRKVAAQLNITQGCVAKRIYVCREFLRRRLRYVK